MDKIVFVILQILAVCISSLSQVILKKSAIQEHGSFFKNYFNPRLIMGYAMFLGATVLSVVALKGLHLSVVMAIGSVKYIFIAILAKVFFHEKISMNKIIGAFFIISGVIVFSM